MNKQLSIVLATCCSLALLASAAGAPKDGQPVQDRSGLKIGSNNDQVSANNKQDVNVVNGEFDYNGHRNNQYSNINLNGNFAGDGSNSRLGFNDFSYRLGSAINNNNYNNINSNSNSNSNSNININNNDDNININNKNINSQYGRYININNNNNNNDDDMNGDINSNININNNNNHVNFNDIQNGRSNHNINMNNNHAMIEQENRNQHNWFVPDSNGNIKDNMNNLYTYPYVPDPGSMGNINGETYNQNSNQFDWNNRNGWSFSPNHDSEGNKWNNFNPFQNNNQYDNGNQWNDLNSIRNYNNNACEELNNILGFNYYEVIDDIIYLPGSSGGRPLTPKERVALKACRKEERQAARDQRRAQREQRRAEREQRRAAREQRQTERQLAKERKQQEMQAKERKQEEKQ